MARSLCVVLTLLVAWLAADQAAAQAVAAGENGSGSLTPDHGANTGDSSRASAIQKPAQLSISGVPLATALTALAEASEVWIAYSPSRLAKEGTVDCDCAELTVAAALDHLLAHTMFRYTEVDGHIVIIPRAITKPSSPPDILRAVPPQPASVAAALPQAARVAVQEAAVLVGRITDVETGQPIEGAHVQVAGTELSAVTGEGGRYRLAGVRPGRVTLNVTFIGRARIGRTVTVERGQTVQVDFAMAQHAITLDELVATGTMMSTEMRKVASPIAIVREEEIARINPTSIVDLMARSQIASVSVPSRGVDSDWNDNIIIRGVNSFIPTLIGKVLVLVDGVETNTRALNNISAQNIERVEVIRGPQAATLYGSEASGGVIQIFTKKGSAGVSEQIVAAARFGRTESPFVESAPLTRQLDGTLTGSFGTEGSYHLGFNFDQTDGYVPNYDARNVSIATGFQRVSGPFRLGVSARLFEREFGNPGIAGVWYNIYQAGHAPASWSLNLDNRTTFRSLNIGTTVDYMPHPNWRHNLTMGADFVRNRSYTIPGQETPEDNIAASSLHDYMLPTFRYHTNLQVASTDAFEASVMAGADYAWRDWVNFNSRYHDEGEAFAETIPGGWVWEENYRKGGVFSQLQVGVQDRLFLSAGIRADYNSLFGADYGSWSTNPRFGAAYNFEPTEGWALKARGSIGRGINAPTVRMRDGGLPHAHANPNIGPQFTRGWDIGVDNFLMDGRLGLELSYYRQNVREAISFIYLEPPSTSPFQYVNAGEITNQGIEFVARYSASPVDVGLTVSTNDNEVLTVPEGWTGDDQPGNRISSVPVPKLQIGLNATYGLGHRLGRASANDSQIGFSASHVSERWAFDNPRFYRDLSAGDFTGNRSDYLSWAEPVNRMNVFARHQVTDRIGVGVTVNNALNDLTEDTPGFVVPGRSIMSEIRVRF